MAGGAQLPRADRVPGVAVVHIQRLHHQPHTPGGGRLVQPQVEDSLHHLLYGGQAPVQLGEVDL